MEDDPVSFERRNRSESRDLYNSEKTASSSFERRTSTDRGLVLRRQSTINNTTSSTNSSEQTIVRVNNEVSRVNRPELNRASTVSFRRPGEIVRPSLTKQYSYRELKKLRMERQTTQMKRSNYKRLGPQFSLHQFRQPTYEEDMELPPIGWEFRKLRLMREMRKPKISKGVQYESVFCGECNHHCERCQRRCCGDCQHDGDGHQHFHWSTHHMTSLDCEDHSPLSHHHRRSRPRVNSAVFASNDTAGFAGFDAGDFLRRYGSQSKLCRKARSADNIPLTTMEESTEKNSREDLNGDCNRDSQLTTTTTTATHHFGLPILSVSGPSPPDEDFEQIDEYL